MNYLDKEIERLQKYAEGLNITVKWLKHRGGTTGAEWAILSDNRIQITMYTWPGQSKIRLILNFLHELGHHLGFVYNNRKGNALTDRALMEEDARKETDPPIAKGKRQLIYETERDDAQYREVIYKELDLKIPLWKLKADIDLDCWIYKQFWQKGSIPKFKETHEKQKHFMKKRKEQYEKKSQKK